MLSQSYFSSNKQFMHSNVNKTKGLGLLFPLISEIIFRSKIFKDSLAYLSIGSAP